MTSSTPTLSAIGICTTSGEAVTYDTSGAEGHRVLITAQAGAGKSVLARRLLETCASNDNPHRVPVIIIDKDGSYASIKTAIADTFVKIGGDDADLPMSVEAASNAAVLAVRDGASSILDIAGMTAEEGQAIVAAVCDALLSFPFGTGRPVVLFIDEVQNFADEVMRGASCRRKLDKIAAEGRKFGIHLVVATQRPSSVSKMILTQANVRIVGRMSGDTDLARIRKEFALSASQVSAISSLPTHTFFAVGQALSEKPVFMKTVMPKSLPPMPAGPKDLAAPISAAEAIERLRNPARSVAMPISIDQSSVTGEGLAERSDDADELARLLAGEPQGKLHRDQIAVLMGWSKRGKRLKNALASAEAQKLLRVTKAGYVTAVALAPTDGEAISPQERFARIRAQLSAQADQILVVIAATPNGIDASELAIRLGRTRKSAPFSRAIDDLRKRGLVVSRGGGLLVPRPIGKLMGR